LIISNRIGGDILFNASGINCADWSEGGTPARYSGQTFGDWNATYPLRLQPANGMEPAFSASFFKCPNANCDQPQPLASFPVRLRMGSLGPSEVLTRDSQTGEWQSNASFQVGSVDGQKVRAVTGLLKNPNDGSWDGTNLQVTERGWWIAFQFAR
jgi:hypothetical protein